MGVLPLKLSSAQGVRTHAWCSATPSLFLIFNLTPPPPNSFLLLMVTTITFWIFWIFTFCTSRRNELCFVVLCGSWHFCLNVLNIKVIDEFTPGLKFKKICHLEELSSIWSRINVKFVESFYDGNISLDGSSSNISENKHLFTVILCFLIKCPDEFKTIIDVIGFLQDNHVDQFIVVSHPRGWTVSDIHVD